MSDALVNKIFDQLEQLEKLTLEVADMVIALSREEYAKNVLSIEQEPLGAEFRRKCNAELLENMAKIMAQKALVEGHPSAKTMTFDQLTEGLKVALKGSVEEYLMGLRKEVSDGG